MLEYLNLEDMYENKIKGKDVKVGIVDSGCDMTHKDLEGCFNQTYSYIQSADKSFDVGDKWKHGTHIAGLIHQVSPKSKLDIYQILDEKGKTTIEHLSDGIIACLQRGCDVINISISCRSDERGLKYAIDMAKRYPSILVSAGGNRSDEISYPARYDNVISVGSVDADLNLTKFTKYKKVDYVTFGVNVESTVPGNKYNKMTGSSQSSAILSGMIALIIDKFKNMKKKKPTLNQVKEILDEISIDLDGFKFPVFDIDLVVDKISKM